MEKGYKKLDHHDSELLGKSCDPLAADDKKGC